jgi:hypothetical protein
MGVAAAAVAAEVFLLVGGAVPRTSADDPRGPMSVAGAVDGRAARPGASEVPLRPLYAHSHALLIGIGQAYEGSGFPVLPNAERDIELVAQALGREKRSPWAIQRLLGKEATRAAIVDTVHALSASAQPDDRVLIYYAGHGKANERADELGWMVPAGAASDKPSTWIPFHAFDQIFKEEPGAKHILVAMDCCYGGRLTYARAAASDERFGERFLTRKAHVVITSGWGDEQVSDGAVGTHSPFAAAFVGALANRGPLTSSMLFARIQDAFARANVRQSPMLGYPEGSPAGGDFVFFREE